jgi:hypothetical protein
MGNAYDSASLLVTPNGYKASKIYSAKPTDGSGDLAFSRASTAMRRNSAGLWESVANNVPRLQYPVGGGCPSWLFEPQATNYALQSTDFSNVAWVKTGVTVTPNFSASVLSGVDASKLTFTTIGTINTTQSFLGNSSIAAWVMVKADTLTKFRLVEAFYFGNFVEFDLVAKTATGTGGFIIEQDNGWFICGLTKSYGVGQTALSYTLNSISTAGSLLICQAQFEVGSVATSPIITAGSAVTRLRDSYSRTLSAINQGSAIVKIPDNISVSGGGTHLFGIFILAGTGIGVYLSRISNGRNRLWTQDATTIFQTTVNDLKLGITWNGTGISVWQNGIKVVTDFSYALTGVINLLSSANLETSNLIDEIVLYNTVLSDTEMGELTTL